jgi:hypothetical protein
MALRAWTDESLDAMRLIGDEPADQLVQQLFAEHQVDAVNAMMRESRGDAKTCGSGFETPPRIARICSSRRKPVKFQYS